MSLAPVPADQSSNTCANCGAAVVSDQRYCLSCGKPVSPVRLAFLDVLQAEQGRSPATRGWADPDYAIAAAGWAAPLAPTPGVGGWLRRNSGFVSLLAVLLLCLIAGLLVGHWVSQGKASNGPQVVRIEGLSAAPAAAGTTPSTAAGAKHASSSSQQAKEEAEEAKEAANETKAEKAPPPAPVKAGSKIQKLTQSTGKKHAEEVNSLGATPIETG